MADDTISEHLRKKRALFEALGNLDNSDEESDLGRQASEKAWRTRMKSPAQPAARPLLARASSDRSGLHPVSMANGVQSGNDNLALVLTDHYPAARALLRRSRGAVNRRKTRH